MKQKFLITITILLFTFPFLSGAADNSNISLKTSQVSSSIWANVDWNKMRNWFRIENSKPVKPVSTAGAERTSMPEGHWLQITPYSECRDDGICPPKNDEARK